MAKLSYENLRFREDHESIAVFLMKYFRFDIPKDELEKIGEYHIQDHGIEFPDLSQKKANNKFNQLISRYISELKNTITGHDAVYVHSNSGIPLLGYIGFGILDRGSNIIEVRPINGCNLNCIYCSVDEGPFSKKSVDFVIEKDYLVQELEQVASIKDNDIEIHIGPQGEPLLYSDLIELVRDIKKIPRIKRISMDTNATLLSEEKIIALCDAGLDMFNVSINAIDEEKAKAISGCREGVTYNIGHVLKMAEFIAIRTKARLIIAPVFIQKNNEDETVKLIKFAKGLIDRTDAEKVRICFQNFLSYKSGRNPAKEMSFDDFYTMLKRFEQEFGIKLIVTKDDFDIQKDNKVDRPFKKGDLVKAEIVSQGRARNELLAVAKNRLICVYLNNNEKQTHGLIKVKLIREKDGIFIGTPA